MTKKDRFFSAMPLRIIAGMRASMAFFGMMAVDVVDEAGGGSSDVEVANVTGGDQFMVQERIFRREEVRTGGVLVGRRARWKIEGQLSQADFLKRTFPKTLALETSKLSPRSAVRHVGRIVRRTLTVFIWPAPNQGNLFSTPVLQWLILLLVAHEAYAESPQLSSHSHSIGQQNITSPTVRPTASQSSRSCNARATGYR
jgi:hypothetical protein